MIYEKELDCCILTINQEIDEALCGRIISQLNYLESKNKDIEIYLNTEGGCVYSAFALYDKIVNYSKHVTIYAIGKVLSCGIMILLSGDKRVAYQHCSFMIHEGEESSGSVTHDSFERLSKHFENLKNKHINIIENRTNLKEDKIKRLMKSDYYFYAEEALEFGYVEEIV